MELFKNNRGLLDNISVLKIYFFIFQLQRYGRQSRFVVPHTRTRALLPLTSLLLPASYIKFLSILCRWNDEPLVKNQNFICEKLCVDKWNLLIDMKVLYSKIQAG